MGEDKKAEASTSLSRSKDEEIQYTAIKAKRDKWYVRLCRHRDNFGKMTMENRHMYKDHYETLNKIEENFDAIQDEIINFNATIPHPSLRLDVTQAQITMDELLIELRNKYNSFFTPFSAQAAPPIASSSCAPKTVALPKITLPQFDGNLDDWPEFISLFDSLVHKEVSLTNAQKFQYLRSSLKADALAVISGFQLNESNYALAYNALNNRYQNQRRIASMYLNKVLNFKVSSSKTVINNLKDFINLHQTSVNAIKALNLEDLSEFLLCSLALKNLDSSTKRAFEEKQAADSIPKFTELLDFVTQRVRSLEFSDEGKECHSKSKIHHANVLIAASTSKTPDKIVPQRYNSPRSNFTCPKCKDAHMLTICPVYSKLTIDEKYQFLKQQNRCFNCLGRHSRADCSSKSSCKVCHKSSHHTSLHSSQIKPPVSAISTPTDEQNHSSQASVVVNHVNYGSPFQQLVLLGTVAALIKDSKNKLCPIRAVLDPGSQATMISLTAVKALGLKMLPVSVNVSGVGQQNAKPLGIVKCQLFSNVSSYTLCLQALVLPVISNQLPSAPVPEEIYNRFQHLRLADDNFHQPSAVDLLLGADVYPTIMSSGSASAGNDLPAAVPTVFGWAIIGPIKEVPTTEVEILYSETTLSDDLKKFWEVEEITAPVHRDPLESVVEQHFLNTRSRDINGRYSVALPFKPECTPLLENSSRTLQAFKRLESRLLRTPDKYQEYNSFMEEYLKLGHMSPAPSPSNYVIPHHVIVKNSSSTTKVRVVFNASDPDISGKSLNERMLSGPKLQKDIGEILMSFRMHTIALCADVQKMYRQILVHEEDRRYQHIFWRPSPAVPVQEYELNTVTYGLTPSAFQAIRVLQQLVFDEGEAYPKASISLLDHTYVDDVITGADSIASAIKLRNELNDLLIKGGFELRKWTSSAPEVLLELPPDHIESQLNFNDDQNSIKILGLSWLPKTDNFGFQVAPFDGKFTKRGLVSYIAKIFDPLGFVAPVVLALKLVLRNLWLSNSGWDELISPTLATTWMQITYDVQNLANLSIPRCIIPHRPISVLLAGFCDASESGYAACVYLIAESSRGEKYSHLLKAKTKVAPLKVLSIPRLELCAILMLAHLTRSVKILKFPAPLKGIKLFSDSTVALSWLNTSPHLLKTFVANRVVSVSEAVPEASWFHISSELNPADMPSRGLTPTQFMIPRTQDFWFHGPEFLIQDESDWPAPFSNAKAEVLTLPELKSSTCLMVTESPCNPLLSTIHKFSNFNRLQRVFAWINRFIHNCRARKKNSSPLSASLSTTELEYSTTTLVKLTQENYFLKDIEGLKSNSSISRRLLSLSPFLDPRGLLRVGGRLNQSLLSSASKHPILLPKEAHLSRLICLHFHCLSLHSGPNAVQALIRTKFWIFSLRGLLRKCIRQCLSCYRFRSANFQPQMGELPPSRVTVSRPFSHVGVDFAGPFNVRVGRARKPLIMKGYLCVFICATTKAVHLEFVSELSTAAFIATLDRFVARRGLPTEIMSDNGRNFLGASRYLSEVTEFLKENNKNICDHLSSRQITWRFTPPYSPHFGGLWEAAVKSAKGLLIRLIGISTMSFEEYSTLFARIEAVLNSRPLCQLSDDPCEASTYLSPGHFLIGAPLLSLPEPDLLEKGTLKNRWEKLNQLLQSFWHRWSKEYLNTLIQRNKWSKSTASPKEGDLVFIKGINTHTLFHGRSERLNNCFSALIKFLASRWCVLPQEHILVPWSNWYHYQ